MALPTKKTPPPRPPRVGRKLRELHVYDEGVSEKRGFRKFRFEVTEVVAGAKRVIQTTKGAEAHRERLTRGYVHQFGIPQENVFRYSEDGKREVESPFRTLPRVGRKPSKKGAAVQGNTEELP